MGDERRRLHLQSVLVAKVCWELAFPLPEPDYQRDEGAGLVAEDVDVDLFLRHVHSVQMTIENQHIIECPEHGLFASPDYWPCPFCFHKEHIKEGPMCWNSTFIQWKGEKRQLTLDYILSDDPKYQKFVIYLRTKKPATISELKAKWHLGQHIDDKGYFRLDVDEVDDINVHWTYAVELNAALEEMDWKLIDRQIEHDCITGRIVLHEP